MLGLIADWLGTDVTDVQISGMAGSRQGWIESPYSSVPCPPVSGPGRSRTNCRPEAQRAHRSRPQPEHTCRRHAWRRDPDRRIPSRPTPALTASCAFPAPIRNGSRSARLKSSVSRTFMTGELFALLQPSKVCCAIRLGRAGTKPRSRLPWPKRRPTRRPWRALCSDCVLKACWLIFPPFRGYGAPVRHRLIGAELAAARPYWLGRPVALIGASKLVDVYAAALGLQGLIPKRCDAGQMTRLGLATARNSAIDPAPTLH